MHCEELHESWLMAKFNVWLEYEGIEDLRDFSPFQRRRFLVEFSQGKSLHTVKGVYGNFKTWVCWLVNEGFLKASPSPPEAG